VESLLRNLTEPFEALTEARASVLLREHWGIDATGLERLETERDDSFRVRGSTDYVLKVAHPSDSRRHLAFQSAALLHAGRSGMPVQRVIPTTLGHPSADADGRVARVLSWLPGDLLDGSEVGPEQVSATGAALARLATALRTFDHPGARRTFAWDLQSFGLLDHPFDEVTQRFEAIDLTALPHQVIHNDFHPGNLLVDAGDPTWVTGILDFGDALYAPRVQDLAVALAYLVPEEGDPGATIGAFVGGYESVGPLERAEHDALATLVAARLVQRIVLPTLIDGHDPHVAAKTRTLTNLLEHS